GQFDENSRIIGVSRSKLSETDFQKQAREAIGQFVEKDYQDEKIIDRFVKICTYVPVDATKPDESGDLGKALRDDPKVVRAFYLAVAPDLFEPIAEYLSK